MALRLIRALRGLPWLARSTAACVRRPAAFHPSSPSLWVGIQARQAHVQSHGLTGLLACALLHEHVRPMSSKTLGEAEMSTNAPSELSPMQETTNASPSDLSLMEALTELNSVMNELILKMQASTPEMKEIGLVWVLGYVNAYARSRASMSLSHFQIETGVRSELCGRSAFWLRARG